VIVLALDNIIRAMEEHYQSLVRDLENPEIASDPEQLMKLMREKSQLDPTYGENR